VRRGLPFSLEAGHVVGITSEYLGQNLQRHIAAQTQVGGAVHLSHPARPSGDTISYGPSFMPAAKLISFSTPHPN
jgi:hypothetical protein